MLSVKTTTPNLVRGTYPSGSSYWQVTYTHAGKQVNRKFSNEKEAEKYRQFVVDQCKAGAILHSVEVAKLGYKRFVAASGLDKNLEDVDFIELVEWACKNYQKPVEDDLETLVDTFIDLKHRQGLREKSLESIEYHMKKFAKDFEGKKVTDFTRQMLDDYINKTYKYDRNRFNTLRQFFGWLSGTSKATPIDDPILRETPFQGWVKKRKDDDSIDNIVIYTAEETQRILEHAVEYNVQGMFAFLLFSGCRPSEAQRIWENTKEFGWKCINWEKGILTIPAKVSKVRKPRQIPLNATLRAWLKFYHDRKFTTLLPEGWLRKYGCVRAEALDEDKAKVSDVARHTFISQLLELGESFNRVALISGNSKDIILNHYATLTTRADCKQYWALTPDKFTTHDIPHEDWRKRLAESRKELLVEARKKLNEDIEKE